MCAACQTVYQEIINLFNHANMRAEITNTMSNFFMAYICFASTSPPPLVLFHMLLGYPLPPSWSIHTFWVISKGNKINWKNYACVLQIVKIWLYVLWKGHILEPTVLCWQKTAIISQSKKQHQNFILTQGL